jgi:putative ABC transport system permease protein
MSGVRASLRIARREAWRSKGRSALVVVMIGAPMLGLAFADVAMRTGQLSREETARRRLGGADLVAELVSGSPITQLGLDTYSTKERSPTFVDRVPDRAPDIASLLPAGSRATERTTYYAVRIGMADRVVAGEVERIDLFDDMARGTFRLRKGALPRGPGEAALSPRLADDLGARVGDTVRLGGQVDVRVTGIVVAPSELSGQKAFVPTSRDLPDGIGITTDSGRRWAVTLPPGARDLDLVPVLNARGMRVLPRTWYLDPPPSEFGGQGPDAEAVGVTLVVVGLATLEIVLLAGTAFAVGARRKRRELALVAATGGDRRDVRRIVLAEGVVVGAVAGVLGVAGGVLGVFFGRPLLDRLSGSMLGPLDLRPVELGAIVAIGAGTALLATLLPARAAARMPLVAALTGRRGETRTLKRVPVIAVVAIVAGAGLAFWASGGDRELYTAPDGFQYVTGRAANFSLVLAGAVLAELGFVSCAPALVGLVGRLASRLPLSLRLAARDAARHRTRSGPAVAAVVAAVAGSVALSVYIASDTERERRMYEPSMPPGAVAIGRQDMTDPISDTEVAEAAGRLPVRERIDVYDVAQTCVAEAPCGFWTLEVPPAYRCADTTNDPNCTTRFGPRPSQLAVAGASYASWWNAGDDADGVRQALAAGKAVVFDPKWVQGGNVVLLRQVHSPEGTPLGVDRVTVPAFVAPAPAQTYGTAPSAVLTPALARQRGLPTMLSRTVLLTSRSPSGREEASALGVLLRDRPYVELYVERGFRPSNPLALLALLGAAAFVTLASTGIATGLAAADSRPDLATLAAVGAAPRVRRLLAMAQAATIATMGSALGILAGLVPAIAVVSARAEYPLTMPWGSLAAILAGVPLLAALLVGAVTRSRLPLERRLA